MAQQGRLRHALPTKGFITYPTPTRSSPSTNSPDLSWDFCGEYYFIFIPRARRRRPRRAGSYLLLGVRFFRRTTIPDDLSYILLTFPQQNHAQTFLAFTVPPNGQFKHEIVWAISTSRPSTKDNGASLTQHVDQGSLTIDLTKPYTSSDPLGSPPPNSPTGTGPVYHPPGATNTSGGSDLPIFRLPSLLPYQRLLVVHAILCTFGFLFVLPLGALVARWLRTSNRHWFKAHWIIQLLLGGSIIGTGWGLAVAAVVQKNGAHFDDTHKVGDQVCALISSGKLTSSTLCPLSISADPWFGPFWRIHTPTPARPLHSHVQAKIVGPPHPDFRDLAWQLHLHLCTNAGHLKPPVPELLARGLWSCNYFNCILQREIPRCCPSPMDPIFPLFDPPRFPGDVDEHGKRMTRFAIVNRAIVIDRAGIDMTNPRLGMAWLARRMGDDDWTGHSA